MAKGTPSQIKERFSDQYDVIDYTTGRTIRVSGDKVKDVVSKMSGKFEVRLPSLEEIYLEVLSDDQRS